MKSAQLKRVISTLLLATSIGVLAHGGYKLYLRNLEEEWRDQAYNAVLEAIAKDHMADAQTAAKTFISLLSSDDPRLSQVGDFLEEATAREVVHLTRQGDASKAERLLSELDEFRKRKLELMKANVRTP